MDVEAEQFGEIAQLAFALVKKKVFYLQIGNDNQAGAGKQGAG